MEIKRTLMISVKRFEKAIKVLCPELGVEKLDIFGSATRADFGHQVISMSLYVSTENRGGCSSAISS